MHLNYMWPWVSSLAPITNTAADLVEAAWKDMNAHQKFEFLNEWCASLSCGTGGSTGGLKTPSRAPFNRSKRKLRELLDGFAGEPSQTFQS
jgi:hypothetical protein